MITVDAEWRGREREKGKARDINYGAIGTWH